MQVRARDPTPPPQLANSRSAADVDPWVAGRVGLEDLLSVADV